MLSSEKLKQYRKASKQSIESLAAAVLVAKGESLENKLESYKSALRNWEQGLFKPKPKARDITALAKALHVTEQDLLIWRASHRYAPITPRKARLVTQMIQGYPVQDALDLLKFTPKRAAVMVDKVLRSAIANADEQEADIDNLYVCESRVDEGGIRAGTRRWRPKDRGRAVSWKRLCCHIHIGVDQE